MSLAVYERLKVWRFDSLRGKGAALTVRGTNVVVTSNAGVRRADGGARTKRLSPPLAKEAPGDSSRRGMCSLPTLSFGRGSAVTLGSWGHEWLVC